MSRPAALGAGAAPRLRRSPSESAAVTPPTPKPRPKHVAYLLVADDPSIGFTGALLVTCLRGRPLEFHCAEPVLPSQLDRILFGPTLREHVCGEVVGATLVGKAKLPIDRLLVADPEAAAAGRKTNLPTTVLTAETDVTADPLLVEIAQSIDPLEPFGRVREAIAEAQRYTGGGASDVAA